MKLFNNPDIKYRIYAAICILMSGVIFTGCTPKVDISITGPDVCAVGDICTYSANYEIIDWRSSGANIVTETSTEVQIKPAGTEQGIFLGGICKHDCAAPLVITCYRACDVQPRFINVVASISPQVTLNLKFRNNSQDDFQLYQKSKASEVVVGTEIEIDVAINAPANNSESASLGYSWTGKLTTNGTVEDLAEPTEIETIVSSAKGSFTETIAAAGDYIYTLAITDANEKIVKAQVVFRAGAASVEKPFNIDVDAGNDQQLTLTSLTENVSAALSASITNVDNLELSYQWAISNKVEGSLPTIADENALSTTFSTDKAGSYALTLTASKGDKSQSDVIKINVIEDIGETFSIVVNAGVDQAHTLNSVTKNVTTALSANITNTDNIELIYQWTINSQVEGSSPAIADVSILSTTFTTDKAGSYELTLTASKGDNSASDSMLIVVNPNLPPVANAGPDQNEELPPGGGGDSSFVEVELSATDSTDPENADLTFSWVLTSSPAELLSDLDNPASESPLLMIGVAGDYVFELTVNDGLHSDTDTVTVTVLTLD
ncbi:MAG: hypothetical protein V7765_10320 [Oleispira sp.]